MNAVAFLERKATAKELDFYIIAAAARRKNGVPLDDVFAKYLRWYTAAGKDG